MERAGLLLLQNIFEFKQFIQGVQDVLISWQKLQQSNDLSTMCVFLSLSYFLIVFLEICILHLFEQEVAIQMVPSQFCNIHLIFSFSAVVFAVQVVHIIKEYTYTISHGTEAPTILYRSKALQRYVQNSTCFQYRVGYFRVLLTVKNEWRERSFPPTPEASRFDDRHNPAATAAVVAVDLSSVP